MNMKHYFIDQLLASVVITPNKNALFQCYQRLKQNSNEDEVEQLNEALEHVLKEWIYSS